jgi:hypothetical protein
MNKKLTVLVFLLACSSASAQQLPRSYFGTDTVKTLKPSEVPGLVITVNSVTGKDDPLEGIYVDLNGDGKKDIIQKISNCGTGGCSFFILDGASGQRVGDLFGSPFYVSNVMINGWPVLEGYHHLSGRSGAFSSYVYDGKNYIVASSVLLEGKSVEELFKHYQEVRKLGE